MKVARPTPGNNDVEQTQAGPKLRNINDKGEDIIPDEKPEGADKRLKIAAIVMLAFILIIGIKGNITKSSLSKQLEEQTKLLTEAKAEALLYGITEDEDGDLVLPVSDIPQNVQDMDWDSIEQRNNVLLESFAQCLLNWNGNNEYMAKRQQLIDYWQFTENSRLLSTFMPALEDGEVLEGSMKLVYPLNGPKIEIFPLENNGKDKPMSYFLICTVRKSVGGNSADGTVGIRITVNADGTITNVTAQTLSQKSPKK